MSDEELLRRVDERMFRPGLIGVDRMLFQEMRFAIERLTRDLDELDRAWLATNNKLTKALARADSADMKVEKLRGLMQTLIDNDPYEPISDAGHTVIDLWRHEARAALAEPEKGE